MNEMDTVVATHLSQELSFSGYALTDEHGRSHPFRQRMIHIGSSPDNDLVLDDPTVSRNHARLEFDATGYQLTDLNSKNGTYIGDVRLGSAYLPPDGVVRFGQARLHFRLMSEQVRVNLSPNGVFGRLIGHSSQMREIFGLLARVAPTDTTVLVEGESGTGKELVAEAVHQHSSRRDAPFVVFDCSAVAPELVESELFGHVRGAFTGAVATRTGVFEMADGGTLFLDEIGELSAELQPKLLRVLETGQFRPVGASTVRSTGVRVIAATNRDLSQEVNAGAFREDLYYRLAVIRVKLPALRQRHEDIPHLVRHFLQEAGAPDLAVNFETMKRLQAHPWRGNIRELKNYVARAIVLSDRGRLETQYLSDAPVSSSQEPDGAEGETLRPDYDLPFKDAKGRLLETFERRYWLTRLESSGGNVSEAARQGGIHRKSLEYLIKKLDLRDTDPDSED